MVRLSRLARLIIVIGFAASLAPACGRGARSSATASNPGFHKSDPATIAATGRPQLLEFYSLT
jgi:hypothetical protein